VASGRWRARVFARPRLRNGAESGVFGLSLTKLLFTILIAVAVWKGFMMIGRLAREREVQAVRDKSKGRTRAAGTGTIELVECARCGAYFDPNQGCRCGRGQA
jgi:hypothetical protein